MQTQILKANQDPDLTKAAQILLSGGLVAFPTETVYGLGALITNPKQIAQIFKVKKRPADNPLIAHIANLKELSSLAINIPKVAYELIKRFWPGPLTLVLPKNPSVPAIATAGLETICVRMPDHPAALRLIELVKTPLVAPSANLSGKPSPTSAEHVLEDFAGLIPAILDAGSCKVGIESTVLDLTREKPAILRSGIITSSDLSPIIKAEQLENQESAKKPPSPGMKYRHYAPEASIMLATSWKEVCKIIDLQKFNPKKILLLANQKSPSKLEHLKSHSLSAANLYHNFRQADRDGFELIIVLIDEKLVREQGIMSRLQKAAQVN